MFHALFSFEGRMNRKPCWLWSIAMFAVTIVGAVAISAVAYMSVPNAAGMTDDALQAAIDAKTRWPFIGLTAVTLWPIAALTAKRLRDLDRPVWLAWPLVIATAAYGVVSSFSSSQAIFPRDTALLLVLFWIMVVASIYCLIDLGFVRGTVGPNRHGPDPVQAKLVAHTA